MNQQDWDTRESSVISDTHTLKKGLFFPVYVHKHLTDLHVSALDVQTNNSLADLI